eukprot:m.15782 g.15782  ORF g.15782 m.15782 type:complete len:303 (+) comp26604_c0_seq1:59-967(+)
MKTQTTRLFALLALTAVLGLSTSARADFTFNTSATSGVTDAGVAGVTVGLSGVTIANNTATSGVASGATWAATTLTSYGGGFGISSDTGNTPGHAIDNYGKTEGVLLGFNASVTLTNIGLGYTSNALCTSGGTYNQTTGACSAGSLIDSGNTSGIKVDMSLFRWTGTTVPSAAPALGGVSGGTMAGWELVGNYNAGYDISNPTNVVNGQGKASSWWLITAYNNAFTGASDTVKGTTSNLNQGDDYFKLYSVAGTKCTSGTNTAGVCGGTNIGKLPEPATLALTSVALVGVAGLRRRKTKAAV